jgi:outer membrane protein OmpA-like peptidoglycan-associated protein
VRAFLSDALSLEVGGGTGLGAPGYGHERWRLFLGARYGGQVTARPAAPAPTPAPPAGPADGDRDGVPDAKDQCPTIPGLPALDGCPDRDADDIPDPQDECPDEAGTAEHAGCPPPEVEPIVEVQTERLSISDAINFDTARDTIKPGSFPILDQIARVLIAHPELTQVRVEGHTDDVGAAAYNKDLSQRRAASVVRYLAGKGVDAGRLTAAGYGFERPVATNATVLGRARNRRVEFTLLGAGSPAR